MMRAYPIDDDDDEDQTTSSYPQAAHELTAYEYDETDGRYADEDPEDILQNALAGIGTILLPAYLSKWDGIISEKMKAQAEKDEAAREAAAAERGTGKKRKKKKNGNNGQTAEDTTSEAGASRRAGPTPSRSARREEKRAQIDADDDLRGGDALGSRKKRKTKKKETFTIDEDESPTEVVYRLAQWLGFARPTFEYKTIPEDKHKGIAKGFSGRCTMNGQLFISRSVFPTKAGARDDVAQDIIEYFEEQQNWTDGE